ncbi:hypothetical protein GCM10011529_22790 [Polymorphobacter glacialis]|uniref:Uncharacterized protein n=2 Tax=Sandarakinorhabdus glacialis TaxID=1614636 RepID=A0A916ZVC6_9SPHN|nr:hypothetical protein GCM10011529_22790 [Polymorphobacter glacialis]
MVAVSLGQTASAQARTAQFAVRASAQYAGDIGGDGLNAVLRIDHALTGNTYSRVFNRPIDRIPSYGIVNATLQFNGATTAGLRGSMPRTCSTTTPSPGNFCPMHHRGCSLISSPLSRAAWASRSA